MRLTSLFIAGFRNIESLRFTPGKHFNLIYGYNGQGKTNLIEALYLLGNPRSFRNARLPDYIRHGQQKTRIQGEIDSSGVRSRIALTLENAGRRVELNGKAVRRASDLYGRMNSIVFSPDDTNMVRSGPDSRRRYLDRAVYTCDAGYLKSWHGYHRILLQRNQLLKADDRSGLDTWTEQLAETGADVIFRRQLFVKRLEVLLQRHYRTISGERETAGIHYAPEGIRATERGGMRSELLELFDRNLQSDIRSGSTGVGPHRDDLVFRLNGRSLKSFGSTGQQKSFVLALKMAELDNIRGIFGDTPLLLLDDVGSELDCERYNHFLDYLSDMDIQVFITATERSTALLGAAERYAVFRMEDGNLTFEGNESHE